MINSIKTSFNFSSFVLIYLTLTFAVIGCDDDRDHKVTANAIQIPEGTTSVVLEFTSSADNATIPFYLSIPSIATPQLKAVVVLHGSGGPWDDDDTNGDDIADVCPIGQLSNQNEEWEELLIANGFAVAFPDSYSPRGTCENEGGYKDPPLKFKISGTFIRNRDAFDLLTILSKLTWRSTGQPVIDVSNVALIGFSDGGTTAISTLYDPSSTPAGWTWKQSFSGTTYTQEVLPPVEAPSLKFKAGVIYYPGAYHNGYYGNICTDKGIYRSYADVMFHLADKDALTENSECLVSTMQRTGGGVATVHHYSQVGHGFDGDDEPESTLARERSLLFIKSKLQH